MAIKKKLLNLHIQPTNHDGQDEKTPIRLGTGMDDLCRHDSTTAAIPKPQTMGGEIA